MLFALLLPVLHFIAFVFILNFNLELQNPSRILNHIALEKAAKLPCCPAEVSSNTQPL